jgi:hypothetical protein
MATPFLLIVPLVSLGSEVSASANSVVPPATAGPIIGSTTTPVDRGVFEIQTFWSVSVTDGRFTSSCRRAGAETDFVSFAMPVEFKYGLAPNLEIRLTFLFFQVRIDMAIECIEPVAF